MDNITSGALVVEGVVEAERRKQQPDERFLRRLSRSLREAFVQVAIDGIPSFTDAFVRLDKSVTPSNFEADIWKFKAVLKGPTGLPDKDLDLLFSELYRNSEARIDDPEGVGEEWLDLAEVLVYFRRIVGHPTAQFHSIVKKLRSKRPPFADSPFNVMARPSRIDIYEYLLSLSLTQSESFWVLEQCSVGKGAAVTVDLHEDGADLDIDYLVNCLFAFPLPDDIAYPLLLNKVVECVADRHREYNGIAGMRRVMIRVLAGAHGRPDAFSTSPASASVPVPDVTATPRRREHQRFARDASRTPPPATAGTESTPAREDAAVTASGSGSSPRFDVTTFRLFAASFGAGLSAAESEILFQFVADPKTQTLDPESFLTLVSSRLPLLSQSELMSVVHDVRNAIVSSTFGGLCDLHHALWTSWPDSRPMPLADYCAVLRRCGVQPNHAVDVDLEHLHREAPTPVSLVVLLRGHLQPARETVLKKLFDRLDIEGTGLVSRDRILACFEPELGDPKVCTRGGERRERLAAYLRTLPANDGSISYGEFSYFWGNMSASIPDDANFVMMLWQSYGMQRDGSKMMPQSSSRKRDYENESTSSVRLLRQDRAASVASSLAAVPSEVRTSVAIVHKQREAPITFAIPLGNDSPKPVSRRRAVAGRS